MIEDNRRLGPDIALPADPKTLQTMVNEVRNHKVSRSVNNPTPGVCSFAAPVFDYSGNIALGITLMGRSSSFDHTWDGPQAKAVKTAADEVSKRLGNQSARN
jgi:DNA-binding IclR family transcriptional regulator